MRLLAIKKSVPYDKKGMGFILISSLSPKRALVLYKPISEFLSAFWQIFLFSKSISNLLENLY